ncbi:MAG: hypothetical protein LBQ81_02535 [Zoogloeaceae bacterium]|nr:hypothetical protein [Zoogloeaceae bacterium]
MLADENHDDGRYDALFRAHWRFMLYVFIAVTFGAGVLKSGKAKHVR